MPTAEHAGILRKRHDDVVDDVAFTTRIAVVVRDINGVAADEPDTKHEPFHVSHPRRAQRRPATNLHTRGTAPSAIEDRSQVDPSSNPIGGG